MKKVVLYPGRFQPMLPHHAEVYKHLVAQFPDADVYVATSNKVEMPKSPFDAKEKSAIMTQLHDIPADKILIVRSPYNAREYESVFDMDNTLAIFAVGGKDMEDDPRFSFKPKRDGSPSYLQKINSISDGEMPMSQRGYVYSAPTVSNGDEAASASAFRNSISSAPDLESAKKIFSSTFGKFDDKVFTLVYDKITGTDMSESLDILRKLAGLSEAPVDFKPGKGKMDYEPKISRKDQADSDARPDKAADSNPDTATFTDIAPDAMISVDTGRPIKSKGRFNSMANMVPADQDPNDPDVKKALFMKLMAKSPSFLLGEINARLGTDDESLAASDRLSAIMKQVEGGSIMDLPDADRAWTLKLVKNALLNMELHKADEGDKEEFDKPDPEEDMPEESVDFSDIRSEYGIDEGDFPEGTHPCKECDGSGCDHCDDKGYHYDESVSVEEGAMKDCPCCNGGSGACSHGKESCGTCNGTGKVPADFETEEFPMDEEVNEGRFKDWDPELLDAVKKGYPHPAEELDNTLTSIKSNAKLAKKYVAMKDPEEAEYLESQGVFDFGKDSHPLSVWADKNDPEPELEEGFDPEEFDGEIDWEGTGDDGETSPCIVSYVAKVNEMGRPVVDPKSIRIDCQMDGRSKLGYNPDFDLDMQDMDELLQACQEDADEMWNARDNKYAHDESIEETAGNALNAALAELRQLAGL